MVDSFLTKWEGVIKEAPLEGYVIAPTETSTDLAASIICDHEFVQQWLPDEQAEFQSFVREVLRTTIMSKT